MPTTLTRRSSVQTPLTIEEVVYGSVLHTIERHGFATAITFGLKWRGLRVTSIQREPKPVTRMVTVNAVRTRKGDCRSESDLSRVANQTLAVIGCPALKPNEVTVALVGRERVVLSVWLPTKIARTVKRLKIASGRN